MSYQARAFGNREKSDLAKQGKTKKRFYSKPTSVVRGSAYRSIANPSSQQLAIFDHVRNSKNHLIVQALAGTGKTATTVEAMTKYVPSNKSILYVIFAKRNATEAESKCHSAIDVKTVHAFGFAALRAAFVGLKIEVDGDGEKSRNIAQALLGAEDEKVELRYNFVRAISLAKSYLCETVSDVAAACDKHEIDFCDYSPTDFCQKVLEALELSARQFQRVDFDDMVWLPIKKNISIPKYDFVFADEAQDLSPARIELVLRAVKTNGKFVAVGDRNQAIFGFTGADTAALDTIRTRTNADILPLSTTYRCGKAIVNAVKRWVPDYVADANNAEGSVSSHTVDGFAKNVCAGDFIISRTNRPLVSQCLQFIKEGRKATILGKDLGKNLAWMIKRSEAQTVTQFLVWLDAWRNEEIERLAERNKPSEHISDKADCLAVLCEGQRTLADVRAHIETMFSDDNDDSRITLMTAHKSKGLETDRVFVLMYTYKFEGVQENNIKYVSFSRAKSELCLVE